MKHNTSQTSEDLISDNWADFKSKWDGTQNFRMQGELIPFAIKLPPLERIMEEVCRDEAVIIRSGIKGNAMPMESYKEQFLSQPIDKALNTSFGIAHYQITRFDKPGGFLHGFKEDVMDKWTDALSKQGFTWERCNPLLFISGKGCATNYHMDFSQVLACQIYGTKRFCGVRDPEKWAPRDIRVNYKPDKVAKPDDLTDADAVCYPMAAGDVLWNTLLTPHWVDAGDEPALSINISHGGLRLNGKLCKNEQELTDFRTANVNAAT